MILFPTNPYETQDRRPLYWDQRRSYCKNLLAVLIITCYLLRPTVLAQEIKYCDGGEINDAERLRELKHCDVIEGSLILKNNIFDSASGWQSDDYLRVQEITEYVIIYQLEYLESLSSLLPNLTVIRGDQLFHDYAFVIYGSMSLKDIALPSLTAIKRGYVNIQSNSALTHYHMVDWNRITRLSTCTNLNRIQRIENHVSCNSSCNGKCWSKNICQKVCPKGITDCTPSGEKCHDQCLGGCRKANNKDECVACKGLRNGNSCEISCSPQFKLNDYRCVTDLHCHKLNRKLLRKQQRREMINECVKECPSGYETKNNTESSFQECIKRTEIYPLKCSGGIIDSYAMAQKFSECVIINGSLEIRLSGGNLEMELRHLKNIKKILGFLRVFRSESLSNLQFFQNLQTIEGNELWKGNYSLVIHDNDKLQELWNGTNLNISNGKPLFYANPILCPSTINKLLGKGVWKESLPALNGNKRACNINNNLNLKLTPIEDASGVGMNVEFEYHDITSYDLHALAGFGIYYKLADQENLDYYGGKEWSYGYYKRADTISNHFEAKLVNLIPDSLYGFYIETLSTDNSVENLQSYIRYSKTLPFYPSMPYNIRVSQEKHADYLNIIWNEPATPNGKIDHYVLSTIELNKFSNSSDACIMQSGDSDGDESVLQLNNLPQVNPSFITSAPSSPCTPKKWIGGNRVLNDINVNEDLESLLAKFLYFKEPVIHLPHRSRRHLSKIYAEEEELANIPLYNLDIYRNMTPDEIVKTLVKVDISKTEICDIIVYLNTYADIYAQNEYIDLIKKCIPEPKAPIAISTSTPTKTEPPVLSDDASNLKILSRRKRSTLPLSSQQLLKGRPTIQIFNNRTYRIENIKASSYLIRIKACHKPTSGRTFCSETDNPPCKCSQEAMKIIHVPINEEDCIIQNLTVTPTQSNKIHIQWSPPVFCPLRNWNYHIYIANEEGPESYIKKVCPNSSVSDYWLANNNDYVGNHSVYMRVHSITSKAEFSKSEKKFFIGIVTEIIDAPNDINLSIPLAIGTFPVVLLVFFLLYMKTRKVKKGQSSVSLDDIQVTINHEYRPISEWMLYIKETIDSCHIHYSSQFELGRFLGEGSFGFIQSGRLKVKDGNLVDVARKTLKKGNQKSDIFRECIDEVNLSLEIRTHHVIRTYGILIDVQPYIVMEQMTGNLRDYLMEKRRIGDEIALKFALEISDGMYYLEDKKIIHRDLAARNCLLDENKIVKISDFGLARKIGTEDYSSIKESPVGAVRWMPPEYIRGLLFTSKSDVWSYGMVLWEIMTMGRKPYDDCKDSKVEEEIQNCNYWHVKNRLPSWTSSKMDSLFKECVKHDPNSRPNFLTITHYLLESGLSDSDKQNFEKNSYKCCGELCDEGQYNAFLSIEEESSSITPLNPSLA